MSDCCTNPPSETKKVPCPSCNKLARRVDAKTVAHHVKQPWNLDADQKGYYFCRTTTCDIAYFTLDGSTLGLTELRQNIGIKTGNDNDLVCYCFNVTNAQAKEKKFKDYVVEQTKNGTCTCETCNPAGRCCLADFPK